MHMGKPAHTAVSPLPLARNVSQKTSLLTSAVFVDDTWAAAQLKTVLRVNKGCTNYCQISDHHVTKDNEMWWFESLKRDNSIFRTRFTTVMISSFFFHRVSLFRVWLSSSGLMERWKMCTLILHYFSITRFVLLLCSGQCPLFRCLSLPIANYMWLTLFQFCGLLPIYDYETNFTFTSWCILNRV